MLLCQNSRRGPTACPGESHGCGYRGRSVGNWKDATRLVRWRVTLIAGPFTEAVNVNLHGTSPVASERRWLAATVRLPGQAVGHLFRVLTQQAMNLNSPPRMKIIRLRSEQERSDYYQRSIIPQGEASRCALVLNCWRLSILHKSSFHS